MKVLNERETENLVLDLQVENKMEVVYARYDAETHRVYMTIQIEEGVMPPYLVDRPLKTIEPEDIIHARDR